VIGCMGKPPAVAAVPSFAHAVELLKSGREGSLLPHLAELGRQALPLLRLLDRELKLGLPLADIEQGLLDRAREAKDAGQDSL